MDINQKWFASNQVKSFSQVLNKIESEGCDELDDFVDPVDSVTADDIEGHLLPISGNKVSEKRCFNGYELKGLESLTVSHQDSIIKIFEDFSELAPVDKKLGLTKLIQHKINLLPNSQPPSQQFYRMNERDMADLEKEIDNQISKGNLRSSCSPYGSPCFFVGKKDGTRRLVVNYKKLIQLL